VPTGGNWLGKCLFTNVRRHPVASIAPGARQQLLRQVAISLEWRFRMIPLRLMHTTISRVGTRSISMSMVSKLGPASSRLDQRAGGQVFSPSSAGNNAAAARDEARVVSEASILSRACRSVQTKGKRDARLTSAHCTLTEMAVPERTKAAAGAAQTHRTMPQQL